MILQLLISLCFLFTHEFYISIAEIEFNPDKERLEVSIKLFTDDLEKCLEMDSGEKIFLGSDKENPLTDDILAKYIGEHFNIEVDAQEVESNLLGKEVDLDVTYAYLEFPTVPSMENININNTLLIDLFEKQSNIVHIEKDGTIKSLLFNKSQTQGELVFD